MNMDVKPATLNSDMGAGTEAGADDVGIHSFKGTQSRGHIYEHHDTPHPKSMSKRVE